MKLPKSILILPFLAFCLHTSAQTNLQIIVKTDKPIDKVDVFDLSQKEIFEFAYNDTINVHFKKTNIDCYNIRYHEKGKQYRQQVWLDSGNIVIQGHLDSNSLVLDTVLNSPKYYEAKKFSKNFSKHYNSNDTIKWNEFLLEEIKKNSNNPFYINVAYSYVNVNQNSPLNLAVLKSIVDSLPDKFEWFLLYRTVIERMNKILTTTKIDLSRYVYTDTGNRKKKIGLEKNGYTVLDFWFLACKPCLEDHILIKNWYPAFKKKNIELVSISTDLDYKKWKAYLSKHGYEWPNYMEDDKVNITAELSISVFPTYIVLDQKGEIAGTYNSVSHLAKRFGIE